MGVVDRFMGRNHHPLAPLFVISLVSGGRLLLESSMSRAPLDSLGALHGLVITGSFYLAVFFLFCLLFRLTLALPFEQAAKAVSVGLLLGLLPPLVDIFIGSGSSWHYIYFRGFSASLFSRGQAVSESITLWAAIVACGTFGLAAKCSRLRALLAAGGAYLVIQACSAVCLLVQRTTSRADLWINLAWLAVAFACYLVLRAPALKKSLLRIHHALPHTLLAACGAAWAGRPGAACLWRAMLVLFIVFILIVQNDHYDREDDSPDSTGPVPDRVDLVWGGFFFALLALWLLWSSPVLALLTGLLLGVGLLYHHPAVRLKKRFCLSYKAEGVAALIAFCIGAVDLQGFTQAAALLWPGLLVLGGATVVSIPKDYKDIESDRRAGIPTYYVVLTGRGKSERSVHLWIAACVTVCLLLLPVVCFACGGPFWAGLTMVALALAVWAVLVLAENRRRAVGIMLGLVSAYLLVLALAARHCVA